MKAGIKFLALACLFLCITSPDLFSQAAVINGWLHPDYVYCSTETGDSLIGASPSGKPFYLDGVSYTVSPALVRTSDGKAIFYPNRLNLGVHKIVYGTIGSHDVTVFVTITTLPAVTLSAFSNVCSNAAPFSLFNADSSNVSPKIGKFSGPGVDASGNFNPAAAGPGTHTITYTITLGACATSVNRTITVLAIPPVGINAFPPVCLGSGITALTQGFPAGGTYTGSGVISGNFDPSITGIGNFPVTYSYSNGTCSNSASRDIVVAPKPVASFGILGSQYCTNDGGINLTGNPAGVSGIFSGAGITDNGNGTAVFSPALAGLGIHQVNYIYTSVNGCSDTAIQNVQVGTNVILTGLAANYCVNSGNVTISGTPAGGNFNVTPGLTDNGNGTAIFSPSTAGTGFHTITYTYIDGNGCINTRSQQVRVYALPVPVINNLSVSYCANIPALTISGNYMPLGSFSGASTTDNGNGTALFNPSGLLPGGPYGVTYTYLDGVSGCQASVTNQVTIHPIPVAQMSGNASVCFGDPATLNVTLSGSGPFNILYTDGSGTYAANNAAAPLHNIQVFPADTSVYSLVNITDSKGCSTSGAGSAAINVMPEVAIITHPVSQTVCQGNNIQYAVTATGTNLQYQWAKNGIAIAGATNRILAINNIQPADIGSYHCIVSGDCGVPITSNDALLQLWSPVALISGPANVHVCEGENSSLQIQASGSNLLYQWYKDNIALTNILNYSGATTNSLFISSVTTANIGNYHAVVTGSCGSVTCVPAEVLVDRNIVFTKQPQDVEICENFNATFSVIASGDHLTYQWQLNNTDIPGETLATLSIPNASSADEGFYRCHVMSACGSETFSAAAELNVINLPVISNNPVSLIRCEGDNAVFTIAASGTSISYQWKKDGVNLINNARLTGSNSTALSINNIIGSDIGDYSCVISNSCGTLNSAIASLSVDTSFTIIDHPADVEACLNSNVFFTVNALGNNLSFQWNKNGVAMAGETNPSLVLNNVSVSDAAQYTCRINNTCGKIILSDAAELTVNEAVQITMAPVDVETCTGNNAIFRIQATGAGLIYQWEYNALPLPDGGNISGATTNTLIIQQANEINEGVYNCYVTGACGAQRSIPASLVVNDTLVITEQPANAIVCEGNNTQFTVHANGVTSYQWQKDEVNIPGKTSSTLIINNVAATDSGVYRCILFSDCDTLSTDGALLTVKIIPQIVLQPLPAGICDGQQIQFDADAVGSNITWQWMKNGVPVGNGNGISGASTQTMVINPVEITDGGVYSARATGYCGVDNTDPVLLTVNPSPVIISQPQPVTVCETQSASFSVAVTGATGYQWQKDNIDLPGKTNATLLLPNINPADGGIYTCRISGTCGTITTNGAQLTVNRKVTITQQPANASLCEGDQATLLITATGTNLSYQWKQDGVILADDGILSGSNNDALKINPLNSSHAGIYQCVVTGSCGSMNSNAAAIAVLEQTVITSHPVSVITCSGNTATFGVRAKGSNLAFQWQKDGTDIPGAVNSDLSINTVSTADSGLYRCVVTGSCGQAFSNAARLTIDVLPSILSQPPATLRICDGNLLTAGITAQGSNLNYQWFFNSTALVDGTGITGSNSPAFSINAVSVSDEGVFYCEVGNACSSIATSGMQVWIDAPLTITEQPANTHACAGDDITLTITATGENITYQWQKNNVDIAGETNSVLHLNALASNDSGTYQCVVSSVCDIVVSAAARVYVSDPTAISVNPPAMVALCQGTMLSISVTATGDILSYQWKRNGTNLVNDGRTTGSQSANLQISGLLPSDAGMYMCEITGTCNIVNTTTSTVDVNIQPVVIFPPSDYSVLDGGNALFTVTAGGDNLTWQWYFNGSAITNGGALSGATTNSLSITGATAANQGTYNAVITGMCGFTTSNPASLTILSSSVITGQPAGDIKCEGESTTLSVVASGAGHTYQWKKNGSDVTNNARIAGAQQASLTISNLTVSDAGSYSCLVDGIENSIPALLYVNRITSVTSVFGAGSFCSGEAITLFVQASGDSLDYAWYKEAGALTDNATIAGSITPALVINPVTPLNSGSYTCRITGACGNTITNPQVIKISDGAVITAQPNDTAICEGQTLNLNVTAAGTDVNWQWYKNGNALADNAHISGSNSQMFQITSITGTDAGAYTCVVSNSCNTDFSTVVNVTVKPLVIISQQPVSTGKCAGDLVTFSVVSNIASATYQWQKNGTSLNDNATIAGSQSALLRISNLQTTDEGSYQCVVTALCNSVTSSPATLEVSNLTTISAQSGDATICEGQSHNFTVTVTGDNLVYQWFRNDLPIIAGIHYSGNNTSALQVINATESEEGVYHCVVTGICQQKVSMPAVLTINNPVSIISQPSGRQLCEGNNLSLSVTANGTGIMYQWQKDNIDLADGGNITGVNGPVLQIANATATTSGNYRCNLVGICSSISTQPATIQVMTAPAITLQPAGMSVCEGNNVLLQTSATGSPSIYTWLLNGDTVTNGGNISGANTAELYIQTIASSFAGIYNYNLTNICGSVNSTPVTVNVNQHGIIILQPQSEQKCLGDQVSFSVTATGNNLNYKWQFQGVDLVDGVGITGSGTMSLTLSDLALADQGTYRCIITDGCGITINSNPAGLTVYEPTAITGIPAGDTLCAGQSISLSITATGSNLTFQWFKNGTALADGTGVSGSNAATLILNNLTLSMSGFYTCRVTGSCNSIISSAIPVLVYLPVQITDQPDNITICSGTNVVFSVVASGDSIKYQWIRDGNRLTDNGIINGAHSSLLMLTSVTSAEAGSYYCEVSGACGIVNSQSAVLTVNAYPAAAGTISGDAVVCQGSEGKIYIVAAIPNADYYKWTLPPGMVITSGENTRQITVSFSENETGGPMSVAGINGCGAGTSSPILNITANPLPVVYAGESTGICNSEGLLSAYDPGAAATGLWQVISGPALIDQPAQAVTAVSQLRNGANNFTWTVTLNGCSLSDTVTINNNRLMVDAGQDTSVCDHIFTFHAAVPASGIGQWSIIKGAGYNINRFDPHSMVTGLAQGANIFKWSVNYNGCISYDTVVVTNNLPTEAEAGIDRFIQADNINLNANNPSVGSGEWSLLNGAAVISDPLLYNTLVTGLGQGKNIFEWRILYNGCISSDTVVIENALMDTTDAGPNQIICSSSVRLGAKNPYPGYGEWSVKRGSATFANNGLYNTYAYNLSQGENVLVWTAYLNGKTSDSVIIINNLPTTANAGISSSVCADTLKLNSNIPYIGTGSWTVVSGSGIFDNGLSNNTMVRSMARGNNNYKWTITNGTCTSSSVVTVTNNKPSDADAGFGAVTCEDTLILNPNTPTFGVGEWSVYSGSAKFSGNMVYDLGRDDNRLIYTIRNSSCYSHDTLVITSHKPTPARLGPDQSICADSVLIVANAPQTGTGIWSLQSGSASIEDISSPSTMARNMTMGENVLRWTVTYQECSSYDDITISNDFVRADAGLDQTLCSGRTILQANDPGYSTGNWTIIGGSTGATILNPHASTSVAENLAQGANVLRWTISKNTCVSYDEVTLTNNNPTVAFAGEDAYLCSNVFQLRANSISIGNGTWSILSGSGSLVDTHNPVATINNLGSGNNLLRWTSENAGCVSTDEVMVTNNLPVNVFAGLNQTLCDDSTILYANPPALGTGTWSVIQGSAIFTNPQLYNTTVVHLGNGDNRLKWTVATTGCSVTDTVVITNNLPSVAVAGSDFPVCNSVGTLSANTPLFGTGRWSLISGAGSITNPTSARTVINDLALGENMLQWTITKGNCISSDELLITNNSPTIADAGENEEACGESAILYANSPVVGTGYWTVMSGTGVFTDSLNYNTAVNGLTFGENTLRWTTQNGACMTIDEITITNNLAYIYAGEDKVVYEPHIILTGNNPGMGTSEWILIAGAGNLAVPSGYTTEVTGLGAGLNTFEWTITNGSCTARDQVVINYKVMPKVGFAVSDLDGCPGLTIDFINTTQYGTTYRWELGDGSVTTDVNPSHTYQYADNYVVKLTAFGPDNQLVTTDTVITIHVKPIATFQFAPDTAFVNKPVRCYDNSFGDISVYSWDFGDSEISGEKNPLHYYKQSGDFTITLMVNSAFGCTDTTSRTIFVAEDGLIIFPNAFTPNINGSTGGQYDETDRSNDVFHPYHENVGEFHMEIYSRWGVLLFETDDINIGWDGYYKGQLLAKDVYVWRARGKYVSGSEFLKTGTVLLIK